jgi:hypothetical protein
VAVEVTMTKAGEGERAPDIRGSTAGLPVGEAPRLVTSAAKRRPKGCRPAGPRLPCPIQPSFSLIGGTTRDDDARAKPVAGPYLARVTAIAVANSIKRGVAITAGV